MKFPSLLDAIAHLFAVDRLSSARASVLRSLCAMGAPAIAAAYLRKNFGLRAVRPESADGFYTLQS